MVLDDPGVCHGAPPYSYSERWRGEQQGPECYQGRLGPVKWSVKSRNLVAHRKQLSTKTSAPLRTISSLGRRRGRRVRRSNHDRRLGVSIGAPFIDHTGRFPLVKPAAAVGLRVPAGRRSHSSRCVCCLGCTQVSHSARSLRPPALQTTCEGFLVLCDRLTFFGASCATQGLAAPSGQWVEQRAGLPGPLREAIAIPKADRRQDPAPPPS